MVGNSNSIAVGVVKPNNGASSGALSKEQFTATDGQTEFSVTGSPATISQVFEEQAFTNDYTYEDGVLTMDNPVIVGTKITVYY